MFFLELSGKIGRVKDMTLLEQYQMCFDEDGTVKLCRRSALQDLMVLLEEEFPEAGSFGNKRFGMIDVEKTNWYIRQYQAQLENQ